MKRKKKKAKISQVKMIDNRNKKAKRKREKRTRKNQRRRKKSYTTRKMISSMKFQIRQQKSGRGSTKVRGISNFKLTVIHLARNR